MLDSEKHIIYVVLQHYSGQGEENVDLFSCFSRGEIKKNYQKEIQYFIMILGLFANLCKGRNFICKSSITKWFPIQMLLENIRNEELSVELRAKFLEMLMNMHVDFQPRGKIKKPEMIKTVENIQKKKFEIIFTQRHAIYTENSNQEVFAKKKFLKNNARKKDIDDMYEEKLFKIEEEDGCIYPNEGEFPMFELKCKLIEYLNEFEMENFDVFLLQNLKLANLLVDFEVISTECSRVDDKYAVLDPFSWKFDAAQMDIIRLIKAACHILLLNTRLAKSTSVKESMSALVKESNSPRKEKGKIDKKKSKKKSYNIDFFTRFSEGLQYYLGYHIYRSNDNSESETINILCKFELCDLLQSGIDLRQDYLLNNVIAFYKENSNKLPLDLKTHLETFLPPVINSDKDTGKMCSLFKPAIEPLTNLKNNLIEELLFLFNSTKNYKLQTKILNIILRMYSQRKELIKNLNKITLLTLETDPDLLMHVKTKIVTFKNLVDQSEIVCRFWKQSHYDYEKTSENFENLISLLNDFENMMYTDEEERIPDNNRQIMLRHLDFHSYLVKFIKDNLHIYEEIDDEPKLPFEKKAKISLGQLFSQCFSSLKTFVKNNVKNQKLIYKHLDLLMANLQHNLGQIDLICEIFKDNMALCQEVDENLLKVFADLIVYEGRQARFLKFFETVIIVNNQPLASLQLKILSLLTSSPNSQILLFLDDNREFTFTSGLVSFEEFADEPYVYHAKLIDLLSKCAVVNANFQLAKSKCQKVIPVSMLLKLLRKQYEYTVLHTPLLKFFIRIFMDSNESLLEIENSSDFLEFISQQTKVLQGLNEKSQVSLDFYWQFLLLLDGLSEKISKFEHFVNIDTTIKLAIIAFHENWEFFISRNVPEEIVPALIRLGDHYSLLFKILPNVPKVEPSSKAEKKIVWQEILTVFNSAEFNKLAKEEQYHLISALSMISKVSSGVSQDFIIQGMLEYISLSLEYNPPIKILYAVIEFLGHSLNKPQKIGNETDEQAKERVQDQFRTFGVVKVILNLMCDKKLDSRIFYILVGLSNKLLSGGNEKIQFEFFEFFVTVQSSENFFRVIYKFIENFTSRIESISEVERKSSKFQKSSKLINSIIKLLQLLCENHNEILQNYIRDQERSRSNFDLVGSVILLLKELMRRKKSDDFNVISRCFEMLTECIQGPCKKNQKSIISSKFLEIANDLLSLDEKSDLSIPYSSLSSIYYNSNYGNEKLLEGWMVSHLKYKCIITLLALLEGQDDNYVVTRMVRAFNIQVFRENLISVYSLYIKLYPNRPYDSFLFGHFENSADSKSEKLVKHEEKSNEYYRVIIENGFMILHLMHYFAQADAPEITKVLMTEFPEIIENEKSSGLSAGIFEGIGSLSKGIFKAGAKVFRKISPADDIQKIQLSEAFEFFNRNTCNIEIVFKGVIFKTYFWLHPVCSYLTTEAKVDFHNKVDRTSEKSKINYLVSISDEMIEDMQYEQKLRKIYGYRIMASQVSTCKVLVFALTLYLNFLILSSYSAFNDQGDRLWSPSYGNIEIISLKAGDVDQTLKHLEAVGTVHTLFSGFIFLYFSIKTIPLFIQRVWNKEKEKLPNQETPAGAMGAFFKLTTTLKIFLLVLSNIDVVYQLAFFSFSVLAMRIHYFFFSVHLLDILYRFPSLQSVVQSIVLPWRSLVLTLMLIFIIVYLFSIWGYVKFFLYYAGNCDSLLMCFRTAFDQGLKNSGGVGMWLDYMEVGVSDAEIIPRFFYDDLFLIIIVIIMMNIVLGLIIDTFAVLREADEVNYADKENKCFICGMQKEEIERLSGRIFKYHTTKEHNEWNYLNFMAYLKFKENTEYSGIESYVYQLIEKKELDWIPQHQGLSFQRKNNEEANSAAKQLDEINAEIAELQQETNKFKRELMIEESRRTID